MYVRARARVCVCVGGGVTGRGIWSCSRWRWYASRRHGDKANPTPSADGPPLPLRSCGSNMQPVACSMEGCPRTLYASSDPYFPPGLFRHSNRVLCAELSPPRPRVRLTRSAPHTVMYDSVEDCEKCNDFGIDFLRSFPLASAKTPRFLWPGV